MNNWEEWRRVDDTPDVYVNLDGDVEQYDTELTPFTKPGYGTHRWVTIWVNNKKWNYDTRTFEAGEEDVMVWQLMKEAWFTNWSLSDELHFVDGNKYNCAADNIRQWSNVHHRVVHVVEDGRYFRFDRRLVGRIEIVELNRTARGVTEAANMIGGTRSGVSKVLSGTLETHRGYHFRWV